MLEGQSNKSKITATSLSFCFSSGNYVFIQLLQLGNYFVQSERERERERGRWREREREMEGGRERERASERERWRWRERGRESSILR